MPKTAEVKDNVLSVEKDKPKKKHWALKIIFFLLLAIIGLSIALWWIIKTTGEEKAFVKKYSQQIEALQKEKEKCSALLGQEKGNFSEYEFCRQFLQKFP